MSAGVFASTSGQILSIDARLRCSWDPGDCNAFAVEPFSVNRFQGLWQWHQIKTWCVSLTCQCCFSNRVDKMMRSWEATGTIRHFEKEPRACRTSCFQLDWAINNTGLVVWYEEWLSPQMTRMNTMNRKDFWLKLLNVVSGRRPWRIRYALSDHFYLKLRKSSKLSWNPESPKFTLLRASRFVRHRR